MTLALGCASSGSISEVVYFPPPPSPPHVVHLKSFNRLHDLVAVRVTFLDLIRGLPIGPFVGRPAGVAYDHGHLYVCDTELGVLHDWDLETGRARRLGATGGTRLVKPVAVAVAPDGRVYVADTGLKQVIAFDAAGRVRQRVRPEHREDYKPVAVTTAGAKLYVADIARHHVDVFSTRDGTQLDSFGRVGTAPGQLYFPMGLAADHDGRLYVSDMMNGRVSVFDAAHQALFSMGRPGDRYGCLGKPRQVAVGPDGVIFVADAEFAHVHLFDRRGRLLMLLGGPEDRIGGTPMPVGVAVARSLPGTVTSLVPDGFKADYFLFVTSSMGSRRISLFAVGQARRGTPPS